MDLSERLQEVREESGMNLEEVHERTGLSISYLSDLERGKGSNPSIKALNKIAQCYEMSLGDLLSGVKGKLTDKQLSPGLRELYARGDITHEEAKELNEIELRGKRPQSAEEWKLLYQNLNFIIGASEERSEEGEEVSAH